MRAWIRSLMRPLVWLFEGTFSSGTENHDGPRRLAYARQSVRVRPRRAP
jgi:hypothetical protein